MINNLTFSCYLIGDDHLLVQCAEILLNKGHNLLGIISPLDAAKNLAQTHHICYFDSLNDATDFLLSTDYDYLFSIINSTILPPAIITRAKALSINFHNAPLPRYAGVHALSWTLLNNETEHGVTWHVMTERIDGGDVLKQTLFPIDAHETALSLSLKCYEHALVLFNELIDELQHSATTRIPQDYNQSTYYGFKQKPQGNAWIRWETPAADIERTVRALDLGHYHHNRLACPKIQLGSDAYIITRLHILDIESHEKPGTLVALHSHAWHISTTTGLISLEQLATLDGAPCPLDALCEKHQLDAGDILPSPTPHHLINYQNLSERSSLAELFWVKTLIDFKPALLPFQPQNSRQYIDDRLVSLAHHSISSELESQWRPHLPQDCHTMDAVLATVLIYLYRLGNKESSGIWFHDSPAQDVPCVLHAFFASLVPLSVSLEHNISFYKAIERVRETRSSIEKKFTFQQDVFYRYPELSHIEHQKYPLALFIGTKEQCSNKLKRTTASVLITLSSDTSEMTWWIKEQLMHQEPNLTAFIKASTRHFHHLFNTLASSLQHSISELSLMDAEERQLITTQWNTNTSNYPKHKTITQIFEEQVQVTPNNTAVIYGKKSLTYKELNQKANQLARCLQKKGLLPHGFAAICTTQELHLIIGILAILKTGAAYIPIDASYPKQHIQSILEDSRPRLLLASHHLNERIEHECSTLKIPILLFDVLSDLMEQEPTDNLKDMNITAKSLAYIIYTSGTTGKPKGVMVPHQGVNRLVKNTNYIHIKETDQIAQAASISFDAATFEIWGALLNGATLVAVPHSTLLDPTQFATFLEKKNITILWLTAALFNQYATHDSSLFRHLTYLLVGGDMLNKERIMSVLECNQGSPQFVLNGYGPTENTTFTTTYHITNEDKHLENIPIGKPIANTTVYILDELLQPTPVGAIGELYTGGDGLAQGYLNRPDLTQEKFINNPRTKSMLYKTGDSVRWMPNGTIEYLGRRDNQVKIRGFRVELEAIQAHLLHHSSISQCCLRAEEPDKHVKILVAYIVCKESITDQNLQNFLKDQLPTYMIPSFFVRLDKLPLTHNGKVHFKKLPKPDFGTSSSMHTYIAPVTPTEHSLALIWCTVLGCKTIGIEDNFFDLGGHSLLITQLILQVKTIYKTDLPLHEFLENPTIKHLSQLIERHKGTAPAAPCLQNMFADRFLPHDLQITGIPPSPELPQHILLTGATGFLGAHLLDTLYRTTTAVIYCLIRGKSQNDAIGRLNETLSKYQFTVQCNERIIPLLGDLSRPQLGLSPTLLTQMLQKIDVIFHNGAAVNHLFNYGLLRAANVTSTIEIIRFAMKNKVKPIHYVSTLSAASHFIDDSEHIIENFIHASTATNAPSDGYSQTKWVAEQLLTEACNRGLHINIYRPGWIVGHTQTGAINAEGNHLLMLLKGCIQLKVAPNWDMMLDMLPVDTISNVITQTALRSKKYNNVFNLINPNKISWTQLIHYINQRGYTVSLIDPIEWRDHHLKFIDTKNTLYSLYPLYINTENTDWMKGLSTISRANSYNTSNAFNEMGQLVPKPDKHLLDIYFNYLEKQGFLKHPSLH